MDACEQLVELAERLSAETDSPREFLLRLGTGAAGIRRGPLAVVDLARGGSNVISGGGIKRPYYDGTDGQIRHFAGIATASARIGPRLARLLSITVLRDPPTSPDGRLTDAAVDFSRQLLSGELPFADASGWIDRNLCG